MAATTSVAQSRVETLNLGRGIVNLVATFLVPGSVQRAKGNRTLGVWAMRIWGLVLALGVIALLLLLVSRDTLIGIAASAVFLRVLAALVVALGFGWAFLFLDAWRLSRPIGMRQGHRLLFSALALIMPLVLVFGSIMGARTLGAAARLTQSAFGGGGTTELQDGRINILAIGADDGTDREGMRTDSLNVVSIDARTGRSIIIGIPRNLEWVRFPPWSPMKAVYPDGYGCDDHSCMINAINTMVSEEHADKYPGAKYPGLVATKEAVEELTGLRINYTVIVDLAGFAQLIDAVGGIDITLNKPVVVWWKNDVVGGTPAKQFGPGRVHLNGTDALEFVRARSDSNDFVRMTRQKCVMNAMVTQLDPKNVFLRFADIANASAGIVETDMPSSVSGQMLTLARKVKSLPIQTVQLIPPLIQPGDPDYQAARSLVADEIDRSKALDAGKEPPKKTTTTTAPPATSKAPATKVTTVPPQAPPPAQETPDVTEVGAAQTNDLAETCSAF